MHLHILSFNKCFLGTYYVPGMLLSAEDTIVIKKIPRNAIYTDLTF